MGWWEFHWVAAAVWLLISVIASINIRNRWGYHSDLTAKRDLVVAFACIVTTPVWPLMLLFLIVREAHTLWIDVRDAARELSKQ